MNALRLPALLLLMLTLTLAGGARAVEFTSSTAIMAVTPVEAERFAHPGGWTVDSQFIDQMGSPYLMANGMGTPVADAITTVKLPAAGRYRIWARTKDWFPPAHPGRFELRVDGQPAGPVLGASGQAGWRWEDCGVHDLKSTVELRLHDLTGYYGRCDELALTRDLDWRPSAKPIHMIPTQSIVSQVPESMDDFDVVVIGGGLAGCTAAVSAARLGARVALLQDRPVLGGNGSVEVLVPPVGVNNGGRRSPLDPRETGVIEEVRGPGLQKTVEATLYSPRLLRQVSAEPNIKLFLNTHAIGVTMKDKSTIASVTAFDIRHGLLLHFTGKLFIDCTGDGSVGVAAGAAWRVGREARAEFGESMAPEAADKTTMGNSLKYAALPTTTTQPFAAPAWAMKFPDEKFPNARHPRHPDLDIGWQWMLELGGTSDTLAQKEETRDELFRLIYGLWDHMKNVCPDYKDKLADYRLAWVGTVVGVRETRRLVGDYLFSENDVRNHVLHPDRIAYGSWGLDDHPSKGFFNWERESNHQLRGVEHSIPYRSLYSRNIANLLMAGRDISATHVGMGTTRVQLTCAVMGQAAGTAAALCVSDKTTPRGIYENHLEELQQQLLKDGAFIIDLPNRDPRDLARQARLSASSEATTITRKGAPPEKMSAAHVTDGIARARLDATHAWEADKKVPGPHWIELAWAAPQTFNMVHVTFFKKELAARRFTLEGWRGGEWVRLAEVNNPGVFRRCLVPLAQPASAARLRVVLEKPAGICEIRVYDEPAAVLETARRVNRTLLEPDVAARFPWAR